MRYLGPVHFRYAPGSTASSDLEGLARTFLGQLQGVYPRSPTKGMFRAGLGWAMKVMFVNGRPVVDIRTTEETPVVEDAGTAPLGLAFSLVPQKPKGTYVYPDPWHELLITFNKDTGIPKISTADEYRGTYWFLNNRPVVYSVTWDNGVDVCSWHGARYAATFGNEYSLRTGRFAINGVAVTHSVPSPRVILGAGILHATIDEAEDTPTGVFVCRLATGKFIPSPSTGVVNFAVGINVYDITIRITNGVATEVASPVLRYSFEYPNNTVDNGLSRLRGWAFNRTAVKCVTVIEHGINVYRHEIDFTEETPIVTTVDYGPVGTLHIETISVNNTWAFDGSSWSLQGLVDGARIETTDGVVSSPGGTVRQARTIAFDSPDQCGVPIAADYDIRTDELTMAYVTNGTSGYANWGLDVPHVDPPTTAGYVNSGDGYVLSGVSLIIGDTTYLLGGGERSYVMQPLDEFTGYNGTIIRRGGGSYMFDLDVRYRSALLLGGGDSTSELRYGFYSLTPFDLTIVSAPYKMTVLHDGKRDIVLGGGVTSSTSTILINDGLWAAVQDSVPTTWHPPINTFTPDSAASIILDNQYNNAQFDVVYQSVTYLDGVVWAYGLASYLDVATDKIHILACAPVSASYFLSALDGNSITEEFAPSPSNPIIPLGVV